MTIFTRARAALLGTWGSGERAEFAAPAYAPLADMMAYMHGGTARSVTRVEALRVPGVIRGRNLLCSVSGLPLVQRGPGNKVIRNPLLEQIDPNVANVVVMAMTLEDLFFDAVSWWRVTERDSENFPVKAQHLDRSRVSLKPPQGFGYQPSDTLPSGESAQRTKVWVDGEEVSARDVIRFDSPNPGLLQYAGDTLRAARDYQDAAARYARNPQPTDHFAPADHVADPADDDIREFLSQWLAARRTSSTAYVPAWLKYVPGTSATAADMKLPELKQQAALETALCMGLDPEVLGVPVTSRTYANADAWRRDRINDMFLGYMLAISQRLSMNDVTRRGNVVTHDLDDYLRADPTTRWSNYKTARELGAIEVEQIQEEEGLPVNGPAAPTGGTPSATPGPTGAPADVSRETGDELSRARGRRAAAFDAPAGTRTFEFASATFSVDTESRTIRGLALPYNEEVRKYGMRLKFAPGSLEWGSEVSRVKFLRDHDYTRALGVATELKGSDAGVETVFRVGKGVDRDAALEDAADGIVDGLSVGVDFDADDMEEKDGVFTVNRATLREVSLTAMPAFDSARVTRVAASRDNGGSMNCTTCGQPLVPGVAHVCATPEAPAAALSMEAIAAHFGLTVPAPEGPAVVDPAGPDAGNAGAVFVREAAPYRFDRSGRNFAVGQEHDFSTDLHAMALEKDGMGTRTDAGKRVMGMLRAQFDVDSADINEVTPTINRPDMYVDQRDYRYPLWESVNKGSLPNGLQPFAFPKFSSATGLVGDHTEGTEPTGGTIVTTSQTVTPTGISGKAYLTREVWDMGGNPAVSTLIWNQMVRGWREAFESATATFLNTLTAATDITLTAGAVDDALADAWETAVIGLQFIRGYDLDMFAVEQALFTRFGLAEDSTGRPLYPMIGPMNTNGTSERRFARLDLAGVIGVPSWALPSTPGSPNNSWLYDRSVVHGWASGPTRLEFPGGSDDNTTYTPVAKVGLGIWGYKAFANSDIAGVRQVIYDTTA